MNYSKIGNIFHYTRGHPIIILMISLVVYVSLWLIYPHEFVASDPWTYSKNAYAMVQDFNQFFTNPPNHPFAHRLGITLPVAFIYKIFGMNIMTTNLWPLCSALIIILGVYKALPTNRSKVLGVIFCFTSIILFKNAVILFPDIVCSAFMFISSLFLFYRKKVLETSVLWSVYPILSVLFIFFAFMAKESAYWVFPIWIYSLVTDLVDKNYRLVKRFYIPALVTGVLLGLFYLLFSYYIWGHPLARFISIQQLSGQHLWSVKDLTFNDWIRRLVIEPPMMLGWEYGLITLLAPFAVWFSPKTHRFWIYYTLITVIFFWFGSTSFSSYQPMPVSARMALPSLPGLLILASLSVSDFSVSLAKKVDRVISTTTVASVIVVISLQFLWFVVSWRSITLPESNAVSILKADVLTRRDHRFLLICSDTRSPESLMFYFSYQYPQNLIVLSAEDFLQEEVGYFDEVYIFIDENRSTFLESSYGLKNYDAQIKSLELPKIFSDGSIFLFKTLDSEVLLDLLSRE